jgi:metallo-beta-lactamase class B
MWKVLKSLPCDIFLGAHGSYFAMPEKFARLGQSTNPFVDPGGYRQFVNEKEKAFDDELARQQAAAKSH